MRVTCLACAKGKVVPGGIESLYYMIVVICYNCFSADDYAVRDAVGRCSGVGKTGRDQKVVARWLALHAGLHKSPLQKLFCSGIVHMLRMRAFKG